MSADQTVLAFWLIAIVGMFAAGFLSDWHDRRAMARNPFAVRPETEALRDAHQRRGGVRK